MSRHGDNTVTVKLATPKKVSLPNGKFFYEKPKRVCRNARRRNGILLKSLYVKRINTCKKVVLYGK